MGLEQKRLSNSIHIMLGLGRRFSLSLDFRTLPLGVSDAYVYLTTVKRGRQAGFCHPDLQLRKPRLEMDMSLAQTVTGRAKKEQVLTASLSGIILLLTDQLNKYLTFHVARGKLQHETDQHKITSACFWSSLLNRPSPSLAFSRSLTVGAVLWYTTQGHPSGPRYSACWLLGELSPWLTLCSFPGSSPWLKELSLPKLTALPWRQVCIKGWLMQGSRD